MDEGCLGAVAQYVSRSGGYGLRLIRVWLQWFLRTIVSPSQWNVTLFALSMYASKTGSLTPRTRCVWSPGCRGSSDSQFRHSKIDPCIAGVFLVSRFLNDGSKRSG